MSRDGSGDSLRAITTSAGADDGLYGVAWAADGRLLYTASASGNSDIWAAPVKSLATSITTFVLAVLAIGVVSTQAPRPHIIVIFVDDVGYGDIRAFGAPNIPTPRLDAMAAEGQKWTNFYVQPVCSPSRAALLTGRLPVRNGMFGSPTGTRPKVFRVLLPKPSW